MIELRFRSSQLRAKCCDRAKGERAFGASGVRSLALRLQQLAAMETPRDLDFLPCKVRKAGRRLHVAVNREMTIVLSDLGRGKTDPPDRQDPYLLVVEDVVLHNEGPR